MKPLPLIVIGLVSFFPVVVTTLAALDAVDPELVKLMRTFDASRSTLFRQIELPAALPGLFTGAKIAGDKITGSLSASSGSFDPKSS